jgi:spermidine synthase
MAMPAYSASTDNFYHSSGLGIGTTPAALIAHGIDTTVVEIDPVVYEFASRYFRMPGNHTAIIDDAVGYAAREAQTGGKVYDYIVHDVFTGGAEPIDLFTVEFLTDLGRLLAPKGAIAIVSITWRTWLTWPKDQLADKLCRTMLATSHFHQPESSNRRYAPSFRPAASFASTLVTKAM